MIGFQNAPSVLLSLMTRNNYTSSKYDQDRKLKLVSAKLAVSQMPRKDASKAPQHMERTASDRRILGGLAARTTAEIELNPVVLAWESCRIAADERRW